MFSILMLMLTSVFAVFLDLPAQASTGSLGARALDWAESQAGKPYVYGATGPYGYDCSGLVYEAVLHADGIDIGRDTYEMLADHAHLVPVPADQVQRGDLAFYGDGHVEFATVWSDTTFGAHDTGTTIGWIKYGWGWVPTMYFRVV